MKNKNPISSASSWIGRFYLTIIIILLFLYLLGAFLAPIFMHCKYENIARIIYRIYGHCHQLAFRSWFLFGEQWCYPRELANIDNVNSYEQMTGKDALDLQGARVFLGNASIGYKVALCQRDIAIYSSLLFSAIIFSIFRKRIKPISWVLWILIGLIPMGLDGISQFGGLNIPLLEWLPIRESTPLLRTITGSLFGFATGFYLFPMLEETFANQDKSSASHAI